MFGRFRRKRAAVALRGAPAVRRQKSYSAESGYVYQYFYEGHRPARRARDEGTEYVFSVTADCRNWFPVSVFLSLAAVRQWEAAHRRALTPTECYAVAKLRLFQAFDEGSAPASLCEEIAVCAADVEAVMDRLGLA